MHVALAGRVAESIRDELHLTQEFLAMMLGVRRASVSLAASSLLEQGVIRYQRGAVAVMDRAGLVAASCECYGLTRDEYDRLLGSAGVGRAQTIEPLSL